MIKHKILILAVSIFMIRFYLNFYQIKTSHIELESVSFLQKLIFFLNFNLVDFLLFLAL
jgi:hypothetical protein